VKLETLEGLDSYWRNAAYSLRWECPFVLPPWLQVWWRIFAEGLPPHICLVSCEEEPIGMAPIVVQAQEARFLGDPDVCDYLDFVVAPGQGQQFFQVLLQYLREQGVNRLNLGLVRPESMVLTELAARAAAEKCQVSSRQEDVILELMLPPTWEDFLQQLTAKERHETRRKLRRLYNSGQVNFHLVQQVSEVREKMEIFLALFGLSRADKAAFMTEQMRTYFRELAEAMAEARLLKLFFLEIDGEAAAAAMCFDYNSRVYLYNNGYDARFSSLSVGLLSKILSIRDSIGRGLKIYDFLKGNEPYKRRLGGKPVPLYRCEIVLE